MLFEGLHSVVPVGAWFLLQSAIRVASAGEWDSDETFRGTVDGVLMCQSHIALRQGLGSLMFGSAMGKML